MSFAHIVTIFLCREILRSTPLATFKYEISNINCSYNTMHYIPMTYLFYNWKSVPFDHLCTFHTLPANQLVL